MNISQDHRMPDNRIQAMRRENMARDIAEYLADGGVIDGGEPTIAPDPIQKDAKTGQRVFVVTEIAKELGVAKTTVRAAVKKLIEEGLLPPVQRKTTCKAVNGCNYTADCWTVSEYRVIKSRLKKTAESKARSAAKVTA